LCVRDQISGWWVRIQFSLQVGHCFGHTRCAKGQAPPPTYWLQTTGAALVQPDDCRAQRPALGIYVDHGGALRGQRHASHGLFAYARNLPEFLAGLAKRTPEHFGVLFRQARGL
jgi:hypothetical protein